MLLMMIAV